MKINLTASFLFITTAKTARAELVKNGFSVFETANTLELRISKRVSVETLVTETQLLRTVVHKHNGKL